MSLLSKLMERAGKTFKKQLCMDKHPGMDAVANAVSGKPVSMFEKLENRSLMSATVTPAVPSNLTVSVASSTSLKLHWSDNSTRETGYKVERSTDGKSFSEINVVGKDTESYTSGGLTKDRKYFYRVRAYNSGGNSFYTNVASAAPTAAATVASASALKVTSKSSKASGANGGVGAYASGQWYFDGVNIGFDSPSQVSKVIPILKDLHVGSVRMWWGMNSWGNRSGNWALQEAKMLSDAGLKVLMNVGVADVPSYNEAAAFFSYVKNKPGASAVDIWEIGNEPNQKSFWKGTASQYVNNVLKAAWDVLHPAGFKIAGAGPTWDVGYAQILKDAGYLKYVDYANFHPYGPSPEDVRARAAGAKAVFAGKPIIFSEWNVRGNEGNPAAWAKEVDQARKLIAPIADIAFYFPFKLGSTMAGKGGLVTSSFTKRNPFYDVYKGWGE